jgi:hypothetical protein
MNLEILAVTHYNRLIAKSIQVNPVHTCSDIYMDIIDWLQLNKLDTTFLAFRTLSRDEFINSLTESSQMRLPTVLQIPKQRPAEILFNLHLADGAVDLLHNYRAHDGSVYLIIINSIITKNEMLLTNKIIADTGKRTKDTFNIIVTDGTLRNHVAGPVLLRGSCDWTEFTHQVLEFCDRSSVLTYWRRKFNNSNQLSRLSQPRVYLVPPSATQLTSILNTACFAPPGGEYPYIRQTFQDSGMIYVSWDRLAKYLPLDSWLPVQLKKWTLLCIIYCPEDAPFQTSTEFAKKFSMSLHLQAVQVMQYHTAKELRHWPDAYDYIDNQVLNRPSWIHGENETAIHKHLPLIERKCEQLDNLK